MPHEIIEQVRVLLQQKSASPIDSIQIKSVGGGSINQAYKIIVNNDRHFFVKTNSSARFPKLFQKEKTGLLFLDKQNIIRVPDVIAHEENETDQILILEWIDGGIKTEKFWKQFGEKLAALHQQTWSDRDGQIMFGFNENNYMGALPQINSFTSNWIDFFINCRLKPQIKSSTENNLLQPAHIVSFEKLYRRLPDFFEKEKPSLLHGDLWSGNFMCDKTSHPVLIDPAIYFGHRSMDLGITTLFGGFEKPFYESYNYNFTFPSNYKEQWDICNLYPLLIHLNLFGQGYLNNIAGILKSYI
ncbi:MAG: fructosamine kinase family protein [Bacteroidota bacterium]|nr:fructosamine kinase family protein [Bacteroidota bacterium]